MCVVEVADISGSPAHHEIGSSNGEIMELSDFGCKSIRHYTISKKIPTMTTSWADEFRGFVAYPGIPREFLMV